MDGGPWSVPGTATTGERMAALGALAERGRRDPAVRARAATFAGDAPARAAAALAFVQTRPFRADPPGGDTYQTAAYTLAHGGDCEDLCVLLAALLALAGVESRLVWLEQGGAPQAHVSVQVRFDGGAWRWAEPSVPGAALGEDPYAAAIRTRLTARVRGDR
jgi:transglutaminase-like putative cysteine protease